MFYKKRNGLDLIIIRSKPNVCKAYYLSSTSAPASSS